MSGASGLGKLGADLARPSSYHRKECFERSALHSSLYMYVAAPMLVIDLFDR